ncbi:single-stranded DNA-binding protein [Deinococcus ficus]|uniref:Uncharacterized protein n=1 Tax=Deinococcus ficus TaxID=317577 RepID=A0A221T2W8_9DEIO|nr:single-stranded DNA-binding protein [Deinococcus ficus]ASN83239.1 hypothetical protein DFI_18755 [Deinococcus ficus]
MTRASTRPDLSTIPFTIHVTNNLGHQGSMTLPNVQAAMDVIREVSRLGYRCGTVPPGGIELPMRMFPVFDWSVIGADKPFIVGEGADAKLMVRHGGFVYSHRWGPAVSSAKLKLPAKVWFSRGAKQTDDEQAKQGTDAIEYVRLISFSGSGFLTPAYCVPDSVDARGNILERCNTLPGTDGVAFEAYFNQLEAERADYLRNRTQPRAAHAAPH